VQFIERTPGALTVEIHEHRVGDGALGAHRQAGHRNRRASKSKCPAARHGPQAGSHQQRACKKGPPPDRMVIQSGYEECGQDRAPGEESEEKSCLWKRDTRALGDSGQA